MNKLKEFTIILLELPDGKIALQRRTKDAPYGPGLLGIFGGGVEEGETGDECLRRELVEETSLKLSDLNIETLESFTLLASNDFPFDRKFYFYKTKINDMNFEVYEGDRAEAYSIEEIKKMTDLTGSAQHVFDNIL